MSVARAVSERARLRASGHVDEAADRCPLCDGEAVRARFRVDGAFIVACSGCGLVRQETRPDAVADLYGPGYYTADDPKGGYSNYFRDAGVNRRTFRRRLRAIEERLGRRGRLLDVGAALGDLVLEATAAGWDAEGVEISAYAAREARARGAFVHTGSLRDLHLPAASFDVVTLYDTVEHAEDPVALLAQARRLLRPDGLLHVVTPNVGGLQARLFGTRWYHYKPGEHFFYFAPATLRAAAERAGLRWDGSGPSGSYVTVAYVLDRLRYYAPGLFGTLARLSRALRVGSIAFWARLGEMEAWARPERRSRRRPFRLAPVAETGRAARPSIRRVAPRAAAATLGPLVVGLVIRDALAGGHALSIVALACGLLFFLYALKYYVTCASVLVLALLGGPAPSVVPRAADARPRPRTDGYRTLRGEGLDANGTVVDLVARAAEPRLPPQRQPFVSVHLALYNESRVVDRLLASCTSFDYERYEVVVVDDSTDETTELLRRWQGPRVRVVHRPDRSGFKGGALQEALRRMDPRAEYVIVFDADFVPPADAIWRFLDHFGRLDPARGPAADERVAAVQGYQWHMLNASENWITKGIRAEFSGSYVLERTGQELFGAMKMISGSVYMIRADVLRRLGWSTSITEDWELTIRLYLAGYKVLYTPYIQAPAECVSTVRRLIGQRMRWAEGHTFNVRRYFLPVIASPRLTWQEKLEFLYYAPYYLQSALFGLGTLAWVLGTFVLGQRLPMWGEILGWSLVVSNALALPLMNMAGVLLEGSLRRDAFGVLSFVGLSWLLVPFQAYASLKALIEPREGGWARTPKSGRVTERVERFRLARLLPWELPARRRPRSRRGARVVQGALVSLFLLVAVGIITVGALSVRAASASVAHEPADHAVPILLGTALPLALLALCWWRLRGAAAALLALALGLSVNVAFLANAVPAGAAAGTSSDFYLSDGRTTFGCGGGAYDMYQAAPTGSGSFGYPGGSGVKDTFCSDTFAAGMSLDAGTAVTNIYMWNSSASKTCNVTFELLWYHASSGTTTSLGTGSTGLSPNTTTRLITKSFATSSAAVAASDRLHFSVTFTSGGANCTSAGFAAGTATYPSRVTSATIVPEGMAGLALLAPALPLLVGARRPRSGPRRQGRSM